MTRLAALVARLIRAIGAPRNAGPAVPADPARGGGAGTRWSGVEVAEGAD